jgi:nucleotide-binding universal stress UspA family protein
MWKVLIAVDGSAHAERAVDAVAAMARACDANLEAVLVNVRDVPMSHGELPLFETEVLEQALKLQQDDVLAAAADLAGRCGLKLASIQRAVGSPASEIVRAAAECGADQIAMGTHGRGAVGSLFLGSVAQRVIHLAATPVLLVK